MQETIEQPEFLLSAWTSSADVLARVKLSSNPAKSSRLEWDVSITSILCAAGQKPDQLHQTILHQRNKSITTEYCSSDGGIFIRMTTALSLLDHNRPYNVNCKTFRHSSRDNNILLTLDQESDSIHNDNEDIIRSHTNNNH